MPEKILEKLTSFDTSLNGRTDLCIDYIACILKENGFKVKTFSVSDGKNKSLFAGIGTSDLKNINDGLLLSGHIDTVVSNPNEWHSDPLKLTSKNGRLYGRGVVDMKFFTACFLSLLPIKVSKPIFFCLTHDEETGATGIRTICDFMRENSIYPKYALVGEPTDFMLCTATKGYLGLDTTFVGKACHSSEPNNGINTLSISSHFISHLEKMNDLYMPKGLTLNAGILSGGIARNCVPEMAILNWEIRFDKKSVFDEFYQKFLTFEKKLQSRYPSSQIRTTPVFSFDCFEYREQSILRETAKKILNTSFCQKPYATEAGHIQNLGMDVLVCGAGEGNQMHVPNESIQKEDLIRYQTFLKELIYKISF
ncbi:MAG: M20/M25/M40 family metallo-hydrolase [Alphaproteobacteria bacterium]|nr:M20/M25/M40 family metallo-hydrolase [Alphaproteobacteria bacterium]